MNERSHLDDRLGRHLAAAATSTRLRHSTEREIVRTARRRTARRRQTAAVASLVAVGGVTVIGAKALTTTDSADRISAGPASENTGAPNAPAADPVVDATPPATMVEPSLVWRTVKPDSAAAVTTGVDYRSEGGTFPGLIVSTAPGRSDDGIEFEQVRDIPIPRSLMSASTDGERIYTFGTAPGVAATERNPLLASVSTDGGATWNDTTLPIDANALRTAAGVVDAHTHIERVSTQGDAVLVLARSSVQLDIDGLDMETWELDGELVESYTGDGVETIESSCASVSTTVLAPSAVEAGVTTTPGDDCPTTLHTWDELGIDPAVGRIAAYGESRLLYAGDGQNFVDVTDTLGPLEGFVSLPSSIQHIVMVNDGYDTGVVSRLLRTADGTTWEEMPPPPVAGRITEVAGTLVAVGENYSGRSIGLEVAVFDGTAWRPMQLGDDIPLNGAVAMGSGDGGLTLVAMGTPDVTAASAEVPATTIALPQATSTTGVETVDGTAPADEREVAAELEAQAPPAMYVFHTADGVNWSVEELNGLIDIEGLDPDQVARRYPNVHRVSTVGNQTQITLTYNGGDADADTIPETLVLVGTPR